MILGDLDCVILRTLKLPETLGFGAGVAWGGGGCCGGGVAGGGGLGRGVGGGGGAGGLGGGGGNCELIRPSYVCLFILSATRKVLIMNIIHAKHCYAGAVPKR